MPGESGAKTRHHHTVRHHHRAFHNYLVASTARYADIVIDAETGRILHASHADSPRHPASLTKMMTLYLTFQALESGRLRLDQYLPVSANAAEQPPSKLGLRPGQHIRVRDAILAIVTESANDVAVVLAEALGGSERKFGAMMTKQARALGMMNSTFVNPSGLPDKRQVTTARDMAILGHAVIYHYPEYYSYFSRENFTYAGVHHHNHNHLMSRYEGMDGIKTGYIRASGFNLTASAQRGDTRLIGVIFGGHSTVARDNQMAMLLDKGFAEAQRERRSFRMADAMHSRLYQGDSDDVSEDKEYVALPAKVAAIFPMPNAAAIPSNWGIQIGAYSDPAIGRQALAGLVQAMPQWLGHTSRVVQKVSAGGAVMYRARFMGLDESTARGICNYMMQHNQTCLAVAPELAMVN